MERGTIPLTAAFIILSCAPIPIPHRIIPIPIIRAFPVMKIKQEKKVLHSVEMISAFSPILSKSQPKNSAAKASTAIAAA